MCHAIIQCMIPHGKMMLNACKTYEVKNNICFNQHLLVGFPEQLDALHICKHETLQLVVSEFFLATCLGIYNVNFMMSHSLFFSLPLVYKCKACKTSAEQRCNDCHATALILRRFCQINKSFLLDIKYFIRILLFQIFIE